MNDKLILALTYYNAPQMLRAQMVYWQSYPKEVAKHFKIILIDDGSQIAPAREQLKAIQSLPSIPVELYQIKKDIPQNTFGARNLAMHIASVERAKWVLNLDIDHVFPIESALSFLNIKFSLKSNTYYYPLRYQVHSNWKEKIGRHSDTYLISPDLFWKTGGYDEYLTGYYYNGASLHFRKALGRIAQGVELRSLYTLFHSSAIVHDASPLENQEKKTYEGTLIKNKPPQVLNFDWERIE
jgi:hypothetical protein